MAKLVISLVICLALATASQEAEFRSQMNKVKNVLAALSRQVMLQQLAAEEKARADGGSGLKQIRVGQEGPANYYVHSHTGKSVAAMHDHSNNKDMLGQGEGQYVLNGVEFRTRHNDYLLRMPSTKSSTYNLVEELPFPPVPPAVLKKPTVQAQIKEMREWFKAWQDQKHDKRDYRPYFRPALCYLEGAWTASQKKVEEPFYSDRHALDADTWFDLQEKVRFTAYTGRKSLQENYAYLPTTIINITEAGLPVYAQWNYKILCHPLTNNVPLSYLKVVDDLGSRLARQRTLWAHKKTRAARFKLVGPTDKKLTTSTYLEKLMGEIPGKDNYVVNLVDEAFGVKFLDPRSRNRSLLNVGYYHKRYRVAKPDAMGQVFSSRGFSDLNVFMAENTQPRVAPMYMERCKKGKCYQVLKRMSYAIPLEIVYLTPLTNWNPYRLLNHPSKQKKLITDNGKRNGGFTKEKAYNGTLRSMYYRTPAEFFNGGEVGSDPADTVRGVIGVLDQQGEVRKVVASGIRIMIPNIPGVGTVRTRYPIMPIYGENSGVWKELNALKDVVMRLESHQKYLVEKLPKPKVQSLSLIKPPTVKKSQTNCASLSSELEKLKAECRDSGGQQTTSDDSSDVHMTLMTSTAVMDPPGEHSHTIEVSKDEHDILVKGGTVDIVTSEDNGHSHAVSIQLVKGRYQITTCDERAVPCWDGHTSCLLTESETRCPKDKPSSKDAKAAKSIGTTSNPKDVTLPPGKATLVNFGTLFSTNSKLLDNPRTLFRHLFQGPYLQ